MTWTLTLPYSRPPLSLNDRMHWQAKRRLTADIRLTTRILAQSKGIPACQAITVQLHYQPRDRRQRDADNLFATVKPCVDGLRDAGVVEDDDSAHVTHLSPVIHEPASDRAPALWLVIEAVAS